MSNLIIADSVHTDDRPLPLIVAEKWNFKLTYIYENGVYWYAIQDWIRGLLVSKSKTVRDVWYNLQSRRGLDVSFTLRQLPYITDNGKKYMMDYTNDNGLYLIAQYLEVNKHRPLLSAIQKFLADAGVFVDEVRRKPETVVTSGAIDPDKAIEAAIAEYKRRGKSDEWIQARLLGKVKRGMFTAALKVAMAEISRKHYGYATNEVYLGLWSRTAEILREQMSLPATANLRDHQPTMALYYQLLTEEGCAMRLGERQELTWEEASEIIRDIARHFGKHAQETSQFFGIDLATGKPLLESGT